MSFNGKNIEGVLLDISGVLKEGTATGSVAIEGSIEAVEKLNNAGISVRFVTNETQDTRRNLTAKLHALGFSMREDMM